MTSRDTPDSKAVWPGRASPVAWGLIVAACCLGFLALGPMYDTNDDPAIIELLSGAAGGQSFDVSYLGSPLSAILRSLYSLFPAVPWYGLVIESCNALSAGLWAALVASCQTRLIPRLAATAGLLVGCSYLMLRVNFMAAAFSLFLAATAWLWKLQIERREVRWRQAWLGVAMGAGYMIRPSLQWLLLYFALPCLGVSTGRRNGRRLFLVAACAGALILATAAGERRRHADPGAKAQAAFNMARSLLVDIPHDPTPAALAAAGWSRGDFEMAAGFGMYDEVLYRVERVRAFLAAAGQEPWIERYARTARGYLQSRFHLLCLAVLLCVLWLMRAESSQGGTWRPPLVTRAIAWAWIAAGIAALAVTRFPPRAFVPLYLYIGALASLVPLPFPRVAPAPRASGTARFAAFGVVVSLLCVAMVFWVSDSRAGWMRVRADSRDLEAGAGAAGPDAILVPVGMILETQYTAVLTPPARRLMSRTPPAGWVVATPALEDFLARTGFASGQEFMRGLVRDRRMVFVVRRSRRRDAEWLVERLNERYAPGEPLAIEPLAGLDGSRFLFFRIRGALVKARPGVLPFKLDGGVAALLESLHDQPGKPRDMRASS